MMERSNGVAHVYDCVFRWDYQSDIDIDIDMMKDAASRGARRGGSRRGRGDLAAMEKRYQDMLTDALAPFHAAQQTLATPAQTPVVPQVVPDQLSTEAKHLRDFRKYNLKTFDGSMDNPTKAQIWLTSIETIFRYIKCLHDQKFKEIFYAKFFFANVKYAKQQKFLNLEQEDMTVEQYDVEFDMLSHFSSDVVRDEAARTEKFVRALDLSLHERADPSKAAGKGSTRGQKRKVESQPVLAPQCDLKSEGVFQRHRQELSAAGRTLRELPACGRCGRVHGGRCLIESGVCFRWKRPGYTADVCPQKLIRTTPHQPSASQQGRVFATTRQEVERIGTVVTVFVRQVGLEVEPLGSILLVFTPSGAVMLSKDKIRACQVGVANHVLDVTLLMLDMSDFDVILGMDWLSANHASIDCSRKEPEVSLLSELVVREYPDVFPDELPRLPPLREVDFSIELEPDTVPISRAPYRMAPAELKELKVQLQKLLDKDFIRPSVSP
ncbi:gag protease polyprotein [Cucumis melo var. makuwa]|uniref:Gag protease polyprotein n=1 Tax=Cucumis melo var. makuwa TaxID=1194695 RepID=A0A5D3DW63_CUCMM|nr:gag protease polyprotein [Cucumis melo var. makuwa]